MGRISSGASGVSIVIADAPPVLVSRLMTDEEKKVADIEAAIETKDSRTRALLKEKEEKIIRVCVRFLRICA